VTPRYRPTDPSSKRYLPGGSARAGSNTGATVYSRRAETLPPSLFSVSRAPGATAQGAGATASDEALSIETSLRGMFMWRILIG
jgi:hypothetical protein